MATPIPLLATLASFAAMEKPSTRLDGLDVSEAHGTSKNSS
jgi:hypothetical protein